MGKLPANVPLRTSKTCERCLLGFLIPEHADISLARFQIRCNLHGDHAGHRIDPRVLDLPADDIRQLAQHFPVDPGIFNTVFSQFLAPSIHAKRLLTRYLHHRVCLNDIKLCNVIKAFKDKTALVSGFYFLHIVLETL